MQITQLAANWSTEQAEAEAALQRVQGAERAGLEADTLAQAFDRQAGRADDLADKISGMPARSAAEAATKFRVLLQRYGDGRGGIDQAEPIFAFLTDLEELARREAIDA